MKHFTLIAAALICFITTASAAKLMPIDGQVIDTEGKAVEYATVVITKNSQQVAGTSTDRNGKFSLNAPTGKYTLTIQFIGYKSITKDIDAGSNIGTFTLETDNVNVGEVVVKANVIRREADRFVVDVANAPMSIGKDGEELLKQAPGVWINDDKISINGKSGTKIYINDREIRMTDEQLINYLRTLKAEDIQKIEVIPQTGADYDANSTGGVIKIRLKRQREDGVTGNESVSTRQSNLIHAYAPSLSVNAHTGKFTYNISGWTQIRDFKQTTAENTEYLTGNKDTNLSASSLIKGNDRNGGGKAGIVYDINSRHSIGAEVEYYSSRTDMPTTSQTDFRQGTSLLNNSSVYNALSHNKMFSATFNYIIKLDSLGSTFKLLADYTRNNGDSDNDYTTKKKFNGTTLPDSLYRNNTASTYGIATATLAWEKVYSPKLSLKAGLKYTNNKMSSNAVYQSQIGGTYVDQTKYNYDIAYQENIGAAYGIITANLGRLNLVAGLRGEYTHATGNGDYIKQSYVSLFPNANVSYSLKKDGSYSLIAQYARTISRPNFWYLNPTRIQISDYTYQVGNPKLKPGYNNEITMTLVMKYKYSISVGASLNNGSTQQVMSQDKDNPNITLVEPLNMKFQNQYFASVSLPLQLTKWWSLTINTTALHLRQRIADEPQKNFNFAVYNATMGFTLPAKFYIETSLSGMSSVYSGNIKIKPNEKLDVSIKKRLWKDRFTMAFAVDGLLNQKQTFIGETEQFNRKVVNEQPWMGRSYRVSLTYNFKAGKAFRQKGVESGSSDDKARISKQN